MKIFWRRARFSWLGLVLLLLSACQSREISPGPLATQTAIARTSTAIISSTASSLPASATPTISLSQTVDIKALYGVHIQFWYPFLGAEASQIQSLVNDFNRENTWGIKVDPFTLGNESELYRQVVEAIPGSAGTSTSGISLPDVVIASPEDAASWQTADPILLNLNNYIHDSALGWSGPEISDFVEPFWNQNTMDGQQFGVPAEGDIQLLFYNLTWARQLGFSQPPSTPEEFSQQACKAALANRQDGKTDNDGTGGWLVDSSATTMLGWMAAFKGSAETAAAGLYQFNTTQIADSFSYLKNLVGNGCAWLGLNPQPYDYFANREALFFSGDLRDIQPVEAALTSANNLDSWSLIPFPGVNGLKVGIGFGPSYYILNSTDVHQLASWLFVQWMASPQQQVQLVTADGSFPLRNSEISLLATYGQATPQWAQALQFEPFIQTEPVDASWRKVSSILEDASQQLFQPETVTAQINSILVQMDEMVTELRTGTP